MAAEVTASDIMDEARMLLNDVSAQIFDNTALLPVLRYANEKLELLLVVNSIPAQRKISDVVTYNAGDTDIDVPEDLLVPVSLWESAVGAEQWTLMTERQWEPNIELVDSLNYWTFRQEQLLTPGSTSDRDVKIYYWKQLTDLVAADDVEDVGAAKTYLSSKTAEIAARFIGENPTRADELKNGEVAEAEDLVIRMYVKNQQGNRVRRRRFSSNRGRSN